MLMFNNYCVSSYFTGWEVINLGKWEESIWEVIKDNTWFELYLKGIY